MKKIIALTVLLFSHWAYADDGLKAYWDAAQEFQQQIEQKAVAGSVPRLSDAKAEHLFSILSDHKRFLQERKYGLKDVTELMRVCGKSNEISAYYMQLGMGEVAQKNGEFPEMMADAMMDLVAKNTIIYQDEISALQSFSVRCRAILFPLHLEFIFSLNAGVQSQDMMNKNLEALFIYKSVLQSLGRIEINHANKLRLAQALAESSKQYLPFIPLDGRVEMTALIKRVQEASEPDVSRQLDKIITTLSSKECGWVCQLDI